MKKLIMIGLLLGATAVSQAQVAARSYKFLSSNIQSVLVTNTFAISNVLSSANLSTNKVGTIWTNTYGVGTVAAAGDTTKLLSDVPLWSLRNGEGAWPVVTTNISSVYPPSYATFAATIRAQSGAGAALTFTVVPLFGNAEATSAINHWTFSMTPVASTTVVLTTNVPMYQWPGATALRIRRIVNEDTDATSAVVVSDISLNGYVPTN